MDCDFKNINRIVFTAFLAILGSYVSGLHAQPVNNDCANAQIVAPGLNIPFDNTGATADGNPDILCAPSGRPQIYSDVWYQFTPTCNGKAKFTTVGTFGLDTKIAVYDSLCPGAIIACNDDDPSCGGCFQSALIWDVISGSAYLLRLGLYDSVSTQGAGIFGIVVTDSIPPSITCAADQQDSTDIGLCSATVTVIGPTVGDACGFVNVMNDYNGTPDASDVYPGGVTTITWYAMDFTDTSSCVQTITVIDSEAPSITCAPDQTQTADSGLCQASVTVSAPAASDNCMMANLLNDFTGTSDAGGIYNVGTTTVIWTVTDTTGYSATCAQTITVTDDEEPLISCPPDIIIPLCDSFTVVPVPVTTDNCGVADIINSFNGTGSATGIYPLDTTFITWTVTDVNSNTSSCTMWVLRQEPPTVAIDPNPALACAATDFQLSGNPIPGSGAIISQSWTGPGLLPPVNQTNVKFNVGVTGLIGPIAFTVEDDNGCAATDVISVTVLQNPAANIIATTVELCAGESKQLQAIPVAGNGTIISHTWTGNTGPLSATNIPSPNFSTNAPGTYNLTYTVIDDNGCSGFDMVTVVVHAKPFVNITPNPAILCQGSPLVLNGNPVAGSGTITSHKWTGNISQLSASNIPNPTFNTGIPGTYNLTYTVQDNNSCTATDNGLVAIVAGPNVTLSPDTEICLGSNVTLSAGGGAGYSWSTGQTTSSITVSPVITTTYEVTVTAVNGCALTGQVTVTVNQNPVPTISADTAVCLGEITTLTATGGTNYSWNSGQSTPIISVSPATSTKYVVTVTDMNGCTATDSATIAVNSNPVATAEPDTLICIGADVTLTASGGNNYLWSTGAAGQSTVVTPVASNSYSVTVTDINGCTATDNVTVNVNQEPTAFAFPDTVICEGSNVVLTATGGGNYSWSTGSGSITTTVSPVITTTYEVTVTDVIGCSATDEVTVTVNQNPVVSAGPDQFICDGESVLLSASGGLSYIWSTGSATPSINVSPINDSNYGVTATDGNGCSGFDDVDVYVNNNPVASAGPDTSVCQGASVFLTAQGGVSYQWSHGSNSSATTVFPFSTTMYEVTVSDINGCSDVATVQVTALDQPRAAYQASATCFGDTTYFADLSTGTDIGSIYQIDFYNDGSLDFFIPPGDTSFVIPVFGAIPFKGIILNANGCTDTIVDVLTIDTLAEVSFTGLDPAYCMDMSVVPLTGSPAGGVFSGPGMSGFNFVPFFAGSGSWEIIYTYTTPNGCVSRDTQAVVVNPWNPVTISGLANSYCSQDSAVHMQANPSGGIFTGPGVTGNSFNPLSAFIGNNQVAYSFIDANGCASTATKSVTVNKNPGASIISLSWSHCVNQDSVKLTGSPPGGVFSGTGVMGNYFNPDAAGVDTHTIHYVYTDVNGCKGETGKDVRVHPVHSAEIVGLDSAYCVNEPPVTLVGLPPGGKFSGFGVTGDFYDPALAGTGAKFNVIYEYIDSNGCSTTDSQFVSVLNSPYVEIMDLDTVVCLNGSEITLVGFPEDGIFTGAGINGNIFDPAKAGIGKHTIDFSFANSNNCSAKVKAFIRVERCTGLSEMKESVEVRVYPNPSTGRFLIVVNNLRANAILSLFNMDGQQVLHQLIEEGATNYIREVDLTMLSGGVYYVKLQTIEDAFIKKIVIQR